MTATELVGEYFPCIGDNEAGYILWNRTAFPFGNLNYIREQLAQLKNLRERFPCAPLCDLCNSLALVGHYCVTCVVDLDTTPLLAA